MDDLGDARSRLASSQTSHAAIDLQMIRSHGLLPGCQFVPRRDIVERVNYRSQPVIQQALAFGGQKVGHHQNARLDVGVA